MSNCLPVDFEQAKKTVDFIKQKKWNSALKSAAKVKDKEFRTLITWMYLKTTRNGASFGEYKKFIEQNEDYPRINRIKYLAEEKIYLRNNSPTSVINWFEKHPPLGGLGKIKLAEAYLEQKKFDQVFNAKLNIGIYYSKLNFIFFIFDHSDNFFLIFFEFHL